MPFCILINLIKLVHKSANKIYFNKALLIPMCSQHFYITLNWTIFVELTHTTLRPILQNQIMTRKRQYFKIIEVHAPTRIHHSETLVSTPPSSSYHHLHLVL